jgi:hypothetical protein
MFLSYNLGCCNTISDINLGYCGIDDASKTRRDLQLAPGHTPCHIGSQALFSSSSRYYTMTAPRWQKAIEKAISNNEKSVGMSNGSPYLLFAQS